MIGSDVGAWKTFLVGIEPTSQIIVSGSLDDELFDDQTCLETRNFQTKVGFSKRDIDGIVGPKTFGVAMTLGFDPTEDDDTEEFGPHWPKNPGIHFLSVLERQKLFGTFSYAPAPTASNPEAIKFTDDWAKKNIVTIVIPQLTSLTPRGAISVHSSIAKQVVKMFADWEAAGLNDLILSFGGAWAPRYIRGSRTTLSNHAWGTAIDINVAWNMLGARPALKGQRGSVRELVEIAYENGFAWGGWFSTRPDGMHFEAYKIV